VKLFYYFNCPETSNPYEIDKKHFKKKNLI